MMQENVGGLRLVLGCGAHHRFDGHIHVDFNPAARPDVCMDLCEYVETLPDDCVGEVKAWHVLEHLSWEALQPLISDLWRVSQGGAVWNIRVPHCTSIHAANPQHRATFSSTFWNFWGGKEILTGERYGEARLVVEATELRILAHASGLVPRWLARAMPNWIFNSFGTGWRMLCERFWPFRFDEIEWRIRVVK